MLGRRHRAQFWMRCVHKFEWRGIWACSTDLWVSGFSQFLKISYGLSGRSIFFVCLSPRKKQSMNKIWGGGGVFFPQYLFLSILKFEFTGTVFSTSWFDLFLRLGAKQNLECVNYRRWLAAREMTLISGVVVSE